MLSTQSAAALVGPVSQKLEAVPVEALRPFFLAGQRVEAGDVREVPAVLAVELAASGKAQRVSGAAAAEAAGRRRTRTKQESST